MTRQLRALSSDNPPNIVEVLEELIARTPALERAACLEAIGAAARLSALLAARHLALSVGGDPHEQKAENLLDAEAVAARLSLPVRTIYRLAREKKLASVRAGAGTVRFSNEDVTRFVRARRSG